MPTAIGFSFEQQNLALFADPRSLAEKNPIDLFRLPFGDDRSARQGGVEAICLRMPTLAVASPRAATQRRLPDLKLLARQSRAASLSGSLAATADWSPALRRYQFSPPLSMPGALKRTCRRIQGIQEICGEIDFYIENVASVSIRPGKMTEAEFLCGVLATTGCGWQVNATSLYANAFNFGFDPREFLDEAIRSARRVQIRLCGGGYDPQWNLFVDDPARPIPEPVFDLCWHALECGLGKVQAVFVESSHMGCREPLRHEELARVHEMAEAVGAIA